jgi:hypothetical protein
MSGEVVWSPGRWSLVIETMTKACNALSRAPIAVSDVPIAQGFDFDGGTQGSVRHGGRSRRGVEDWQL